MENRKTIEKINDTKSWFFKISKSSVVVVSKPAKTLNEKRNSLDILDGVFIKYVICKVRSNGQSTSRGTTH